MTLEEYQERLHEIIDKHLENCDNDPAHSMESWFWLMEQSNKLIEDYYGEMKRKGGNYEQKA